MEQRSNGLLTVKRGQDGKIVTKDGQPVVVAGSGKALDVVQAQQMASKLGYDFEPPKPNHRGFFDSIGHFLNQEIIHPVYRDVVKPTISTAMKGLNAVNAATAQSRILNTAGLSTQDAQRLVTDTEAQANDMRIKGYDPTSIWSRLAYEASGKAIADDSKVVDKYGQDAVNKVDAYLQDPDAVRSQIYNDPNSYQKGPDGKSELTKSALDRLNWYNSDQVREIAGGLTAAGATIGNEVTNAIGVNPVKHPHWYAITNAASNLAAAFLVDPLLVGSKIYKSAKAAKVGATFDSNLLASRLDPSLKGIRYAALRRNTQNFLDLTHQWAAAARANDTATAARLDGELASRYREWNPLRDEVLGRARRVIDQDGQAVIDLTDSNPIYTLGDFADYLASSHAATRIMTGKAAAQSAYMPGAISDRGFRLIKGKMAGWLNARATLRSENAESAVSFRAEHDPAFRQDWIDEGLLQDLQPEADDAVDGVTGSVISSKSGNVAQDLRLAIDYLAVHADQADVANETEKSLNGLLAKFNDMWGKSVTTDDTGNLVFREGTSSEEIDQISQDIDHAQELLTEAHANAADAAAGAKAAESRIYPPEKALSKLPASQRRKYGLTPKGVGRVSYNLRRNGSYTGNRRFWGWASPTAVAARSRLGAQRLTHLLPRNTVFNIAAVDTADKVYDYMLQYGDRSSASAMRTAFLLGDGGTRKSIIDGMIDQTAEAAGLGKTKAGQLLLETERAKVQQYSTAGNNLMDSNQPVAMAPGQVRQTWQLSDFRQLQHAASKVGLWEATMGRAMTAYQLDTMMGVLKMGWLLRYATVTRNQLEGWMNVALRGQLGDALKVKAAASIRNSEAWGRGFGLEASEKYMELRGKGLDLDQQIARLKGAKGVSKLRAERDLITRQMKLLENDPKVVYDLGGEKLADLQAKAASGDLLAKDELKKLTDQMRDIKNASLLTGKQLGRSAFSDRISRFYPLAKAGQAYRAIYGRDMTEGVLSALETIGSQELAEFMENYTRQVMSGTLGLEQAAKESKEVAENGFGPSYVRRIREAYSRETKGAQSVSWNPIEVHSLKDVDKLANALAMRVNESPDIARAALDVIQNGAPVSGVVDAVDRLDTVKRHLMGWGDRFWPTGGGNAVRTADEDEIAVGKLQHAREIVADYRALLTGRDGEVNPDLAQYIRDVGLAPTEDWLAKNLTMDQLPERVVAPEVTALANGGTKGLINSMLDLAGAGYGWLVERPLQRTTTSPVFLANYANARYGLNADVEAMVEQGISREAAESLAKEVAVRNAWIKTETTVDDPGQKSQFDIVARNIFPFSRAMQAMIRRWGSLFWKDPIAAHKLQLAYEGAVQSGLIYNNDYGEPTFVYPTSGVFGLIMQEVSKLPGPLHGIAKFPIASDMTGGVLMSVPGAENPLRLSASPFVMLPLRELKGLLPGNDQIMFDEIDSAINGPVGVGETFSQFEPTVAKHFYRAMNPDERSAAFASATAGAIANLAAAGMIPPPDASEAVQQQFINDLQTQVRSQLFLRAIFGFAVPAAPSNPTDAVNGTGADFAFQLQGIKSLDSEYKKILSDTSGDLGRANAIWTAMHPDKVVYDMEGAIKSAKLAASAYETPQSESTTSHADIPDTEATLKWMTENRDFINKYGSVAAYFLPEAASNEPFNDQAYKLQQLLGLRQKKTPTEFLTGVQVRNAQSVYYPVVDQVTAEIDQLRQAGQTHLAADLNDKLDVWKKNFKAHNPAFGADLATFSSYPSGAQGQLADLRQMVENKEVPNGWGPTVALLVKNYEGYEEFYDQHRGSDNQDTALRQAALNMLNQWAQQHIPAGSGLQDLWNGVFHELDNSIVDLTDNGEGQ